MADRENPDHVSVDREEDAIDAAPSVEEMPNLLTESFCLGCQSAARRVGLRGRRAFGLRLDHGDGRAAPSRRDPPRAEIGQRDRPERVRRLERAPAVTDRTAIGADLGARLRRASGLTARARHPAAAARLFALADAAIQDATKYATEIPFRTMQRTFDAFEIIKAMADQGNPNSASDAGVAALCARSAIMVADLYAARSAPSPDSPSPTRGRIARACFRLK